MKSSVLLKPADQRSECTTVNSGEPNSDIWEIRNNQNLPQSELTSFYLQLL